MVKRLLAAALLAAMTAGGAFGMTGAQAVEPAGDVKIVPAGVTIIFNPSINGRRCYARGPYCGYYYRGYWYQRQWWLMPPPPRPIWAYNYRIHGPRYAVRRPGFVYFYRGYWYRRPWWTYRY